MFLCLCKQHSYFCNQWELVDRSEWHKVPAAAAAVGLHFDKHIRNPLKYFVLWWLGKLRHPPVTGLAVCDRFFEGSVQISEAMNRIESAAEGAATFWAHF